MKDSSRNKALLLIRMKSELSFVESSFKLFDRDKICHPGQIVSNHLTIFSLFRYYSHNNNNNKKTSLNALVISLELWPKNNAKTKRVSFMSNSNVYCYAENWIMQS